MMDSAERWGCLFSSESSKILLEIATGDMIWDMTNFWEAGMINEGLMNAGGEKSF